MKVSTQRKQKLHQMQDAAYEEGVDYAGSKPAERTLLGASSSSRRGFSVKGAAELNERGSSRWSLDIPPSWLIDHSACVGTCPYTSSADHLHPAIPSSAGSTSHNSAHHWDAHRVKPAYERSQAAPNAVVTWHTTHTFHHHHYYEWADAARGPTGSCHACPGRGCCVTNSPHDLCSHEGPPRRLNRAHECPDNKPSPARGPVACSQSKRFEQGEDLYAAVASSSTVFQAKPSLKQCNRQLTPFPSTHGFPFVLCQSCSQLLLLPPGTLLLPPSATLLPHLPLHVKLKCGYCLNISKFSTRHIHRASPSPPPTAGTGPPSPLPPVKEIPSMPSFCPKDGIMQLKHVEAEVPLNETSEKSNNVVSELPINGNGEHTQKYGNLETEEPLIGLNEHTSNQQHSETVEPLNGICEYAPSLINGNGEHTQEYENLKTGANGNGVCEHASKQEHIEAAEPLNGICGDSLQLKHAETGAPSNGKCGQTSQDNDVETGDGKPECSSAQNSIKTGAHSNGKCGPTSEGKDAGTEEFVNGTPKNIIKTGAHNNGVSVPAGISLHNAQPNREEEITAFSSVQDWVDSLTVEYGYESDPQLQGPFNCENGCVDGCEKHDSSHHRPPLHQHFGYNGPLELFEKVFSSEDEEIKARIETNSMASSSSSSINGQRLEIKAASMHVCTPSLRGWTAVNTYPDSPSLANGIISPKGEERSLAGFLKRGLLQKGRLLPVSPKTRVVVNGHVLSSAAVKKAEERAGKLRTGSYWYDCKAGFWGVEGGPCLGILPPFIEELNYPMLKNCSNGDTQVYVNGRELHVKDLAVLSQRGLSQRAGRAYELGFDGVLVDETTRLEVKRLGKLAPTVERRGKGFGMFTAQVIKLPDVHQIKLANSSH